MILFFPFDLLSHYLRCMQLAEAVEGEEILFPSSLRYHQRLEEKGFATFAYQGMPTQDVMRASEDFRFSWIKEDVLEKALLEQIAIIQHYRPRLIVGDATFTLRMAAAYTGVPFVSLLNAYLSDYYLYPRSLPSTHWVPRSFSFMPNKVYNAISIQAEKILLSWLHRPFRKLAKKYNLSPKQHLLQELQGDLTLLPDLPELFPQTHLPDYHMFIGPLCDSGHQHEIAIEKWLHADKKTLFVTVGSSDDMSPFLFLADESYGDFQILVAGQGAHLLKAPHIFSQEFIHVAHLLPAIDLFICHGGNGSIYQALQAGIPILCHPSHFEQEWNVQALERKGWGARLKGPMEVKDQIHAWANLKGTEAWKRDVPIIQTEEATRLFKEKIKAFLS